MLDILIPHYNDPKGFLLSLRSIESQTWTGDMRVVVVDDYSTDENYNAVKDILDQISLPFLLTRNTANLGRPKTRNRLLELTDGDYVAWLDAGDEWYPEKLKTQFNTLFAHRAAGHSIANIWVTCDYDWKWENQKEKPIQQDVNNDQFKKLIHGDTLRAYLWTLLCPKDSLKLVGQFDESLPRLQDLDYFLRFVSSGGEIINTNTNQSLCCYHKSDIGRNAKEISRCYDHVYQKHKPRLYNYPRNVGKAMRFKGYLNAARFARNNSDHLIFLKLIGQAFITAPRTFIKTVIRKGLSK